MSICYKLWQSFYGFGASVCEKYPNKLTKNNYLDKKFQKGPAKMGENMCYKWATTLEAKTTCKNKVCKQSHYVLRMFWVQKKSFYVIVG